MRLFFGEDIPLASINEAMGLAKLFVPTVVNLINCRVVTDYPKTSTLQADVLSQTTRNRVLSDVLRSRMTLSTNLFKIDTTLTEQIR